MPAANPLHVVVRLMPSTGLEGAFRVHVQPESLNQASLKVGDVCKIESESDKDGATITGYGIAWRAADGMTNRPKNRPIKMTETIRTAFGFDEGSRVTISSTDVKIVPADSIVLTDVTPAEYAQSEDDGRWKLRTTGLLASCEAIAAGIEFDVVTANKKSKRRFCIESIESAAAVAETSLFIVDDRTQVSFPGQEVQMPNGTPKPVKVIDEPVRTRTTPGLDTSEIGGLLEQCQALNHRLEVLLDDHVPPQEHIPILLHGYEGCGKTLLLDQLAEVQCRQVSRLDRSILDGGSISKNKDIIRNVFQEATANQPALIIMDNMEDWLPTDDVAYNQVLANELLQMRKRRSRVLVVGATRSPSNLNSRIIGGRKGFQDLIEITIPDLAAREKILLVLGVEKEISSILASQTHGFTGKDVIDLFYLADIIASDRYRSGLKGLREYQKQLIILEQQHKEKRMLAHEEQNSAANESEGGRKPPAYEEVSMLQAPASENDPTSTFVYSPVRKPTVTDFEKAKVRVKPTALREIFTEKPTIRWSDIGGSEKVKEDFDNIIGWVTTKKDMIAKIDYHPPKGMLLYGPPGCSKTLTAQAVANEYNYNFIVVKGAELISMYVGESERAVREVFRKAKAAAPCVIFFDEIDSIGEDRDTSGTKGLNVLTTLLNEMDGFENLKDVLILAATNKPETLDPALMRPGRFDRKIYLGPPNDAARREILSIATRRAPISRDVNFDHLVKETAKYSGADIVRLCEAAKESCLRRDGTELTQSDFLQAREDTERSISDEMLHAYEEFQQKKRDVK